MNDTLTMYLPFGNEEMNSIKPIEFQRLSDEEVDWLLTAGYMHESNKYFKMLDEKSKEVVNELFGALTKDPQFGSKIPSVTYEQFELFNLG